MGGLDARAGDPQFTAPRVRTPLAEEVAIARGLRAEAVIPVAVPKGRPAEVGTQTRARPLRGWVSEPRRQ